jgi:hypothetical protein
MEVGWRGLMLDLSGHVETIDQRSGSYVDCLGTFKNGAYAYRTHAGIDAPLYWLLRIPDYRTTL